MCRRCLPLTSNVRRPLVTASSLCAELRHTPSVSFSAWVPCIVLRRLSAAHALAWFAGAVARASALWLRFTLVRRAFVALLNRPPWLFTRRTALLARGRLLVRLQARVQVTLLHFSCRAFVVGLRLTRRSRGQATAGHVGALVKAQPPLLASHLYVRRQRMRSSQPSTSGVRMHSLRFACGPSNQLTRNTQPGIPLRAPFASKHRTFVSQLGGRSQTRVATLVHARFALPLCVAPAKLRRAHACSSTHIPSSAA